MRKKLYWLTEKEQKPFGPSTFKMLRYLWGKVLSDCQLGISAQNLSLTLFFFEKKTTYIGEEYIYVHPPA